MAKHLPLFALLALSAFATHAGGYVQHVPGDVSDSRQQFPLRVARGETVDLSIDFFDAGEPLAIDGATVTLHTRTNGMDAAESWQTSGTATNNSALFVLDVDAVLPLAFGQWSCVAKRDGRTLARVGGPAYVRGTAAGTVAADPVSALEGYMRQKPSISIPDADAARGIAFEDSHGCGHNGAVEIGAGARAEVSQEAISAAPSNTVVRSVSVAVGPGADATDPSNPVKNQAIAVGNQARAGAVNAIAIGSGVRHADEDDMSGGNAYALGPQSIAIGYSAKAVTNNAVQIGPGTNDVAYSLQFMNTPIVRNGKVLGGTTSNEVVRLIQDETSKGVMYGSMHKTNVVDEATGATNAWSYIKLEGVNDAQGTDPMFIMAVNEDTNSPYACSFPVYPNSPNRRDIYSAQTVDMIAAGLSDAIWAAAGAATNHTDAVATAATNYTDAAIAGKADLTADNVFSAGNEFRRAPSVMDAGQFDAANDSNPDVSISFAVAGDDHTLSEPFSDFARAYGYPEATIHGADTLDFLRWDDEAGEEVVAFTLNLSSFYACNFDAGGCDVEVSYYSPVGDTWAYAYGRLYFYQEVGDGILSGDLSWDVGGDGTTGGEYPDGGTLGSYVYFHGPYRAAKVGTVLTDVDMSGVKDRLSNVENAVSSIPAGAQANVIESVQVDGEALPVSQKAVNVPRRTPMAAIAPAGGVYALQDLASQRIAYPAGEPSITVSLPQARSGYARSLEVVIDNSAGGTVGCVAVQGAWTDFIPSVPHGSVFEEMCLVDPGTIVRLGFGDANGESKHFNDALPLVEVSRRTVCLPRGPACLDGLGYDRAHDMRGDPSLNNGTPQRTNENYYVSSYGWEQDTSEYGDVSTNFYAMAPNGTTWLASGVQWFCAPALPARVPAGGVFVTANPGPYPALFFLNLDPALKPFIRTPRLDNGIGTFSFDARNASGTTSKIALEVAYVDDPGDSDWTSVQEWALTSTGYYYCTDTINDAGVRYARIRRTARNTSGSTVYAGYIGIDNIRATRPSTAALPDSAK